MLTNNWLSCIGNGIFGTDTKNKDTVGNSSGLAILKNALWFSLGTGATPAKRTDFTLEAEIDSSKYVASLTKGYTTDYSLENAYYQLQCLVTNNSEEVLSFQEMGLFAKNSAQNYATTFLIAREVFDSPITLAPGETKSFVLKLF